MEDLNLQVGVVGSNIGIDTRALHKERKKAEGDG
jgi:hypothetical protein